MTYHEICTDDILWRVINPPEPWTENVQCISVKSDQGAQAAISFTTAWVMDFTIIQRDSHLAKKFPSA